MRFYLEEKDGDSWKRLLGRFTKVTAAQDSAYAKQKEGRPGPFRVVNDNGERVGFVPAPR